MGNNNTICNDKANQGEELNIKNKEEKKEMPWENKDDERKYLSEAYYE